VSEDMVCLRSDDVEVGGLPKGWPMMGNWLEKAL
jgi:hypothetical protein